MDISSSSFTSLYQNLFAELAKDNVYVSAPRGQGVLEVLGAHFELTNPLDRLPVVPARNFSLSYWIAEMVWYLSADNMTDWISHYAPFWKSITDDGITANSAYGARIWGGNHPAIGGHNTSQWDYVVAELKRDPDSRRAVIHIRTPWDSWNAVKDVPCTLSLQYFIRGGALHCVATMRSTDIVLGLAYDVPAFTFFQEMLAVQLGVRVGTYIHNSGSLHCYERHHPMMKKIVAEPVMANIASVMPPLPENPQIGWNLIPAEQIHIRGVDGDVTGLCAHLSDMYLASFDEYFHDWYRILAAFWLKKLDRPQEAREALDSVSHSCYRIHITSDT